MLIDFHPTDSARLSNEKKIDHVAYNVVAKAEILPVHILESGKDSNILHN